MKFLAYVHAYVPDHGAGAETTLHDLLRALVARGHSCTVLLSRRFEGDRVEADYWIDGVQVIAHREDDREQAGRWMLDSDVILTHLDSTERVCAMKHIHGKPIIQVIHNSMSITTGYLALGADLVVHNTEWVKEAHGNALKFTVVPIGVPGGLEWRGRTQWTWDEIVVHPPVHAEDYKDAVGPHDKITLINLWPGGTYGETHTGKGSDVFWPLARAMTDVQFLGVKGGYGEQEIWDLPNVEIIENTQNVRDDVYGRTKVLLVPSRYESFGRVAVEAAASGIPTIAHPTPGLKEALGPDGLYCHRDDHAAWSRTIRRLLTDDSFYREQQQIALARSAYWGSRRHEETRLFCESAEGLARKG